jgi:cell division protein FtsQ
MDRSPAGRVALGRPFGFPAPRRAGRGATARGRRRRLDGRSRRWQRPFSVLAGLARDGVLFARHHRRLRVALIATVISLPLLAGGWVWLRDSPFVSVERVQISGVHGPEAGAIDAALTRAARRMSTLDVTSGALRAAVAPYRVVREVRAIPSFPHGLRIRVVEQLPVAALTVAGVRTAVAADGVVLGPALLSGSLPALAGGATRATVGLLTEEHVRGGSLLASLTVLGAAPASLRGVLARAYLGPKGVTILMRNGLLAYFGDATRPHAKWLSLARVLADPSSAGAAYVDVRMPERPAAGFPGGVAPEASTTAAEPTSASESTTAAALSADLASALGGTPSTGSTTGREEAASGAAPSETASSAPAQTGAQSPSEASPAPAQEASPSAPAPGG